MPRDGAATRNKILDAAQALILDRGFAGVSVEKVIDQVGITKGAFFYHFKSKNDLAVALLQRFGEMDADILREYSSRAEKLSRDPLQQLLIFVGLFEEMFDRMDQPVSGCLFASYVYELQQFDAETKKFISDSFMEWRRQLKQRLDVIVEHYPPKIPVDTASLADAFTVVLEGAYITAKALREPRVIAQQLRHYKNYLELLFS